MPRVVVNGKFDILTVAHFNLINHARRYAGFGGEVMVAIDTDKRIQKSDPRLPIFSQDIRIINLKVLRLLDVPMVNKVTLFDTDDDLIQILKAFKPDYMVKGEDWFGKPIVGSELMIPMIWFPVEKNGISEKISSSSIIKTILENYEHGTESGV